MARGKDLLLLVVSFGSLLAGILASETFAPLRPYPVLCMTALLFLSFLSVHLAKILETARRTPLRIMGFLGFRLIALPVVTALFFRWVWPEYGLAAMLLAGISTGAVAPFFAQLLGANPSFVLVVVVLSSLAVPLTLPPLVALLFHREIDIPLLVMMRLLGLVVFIPLAAAEALKKFALPAADLLRRHQYSLSLVLFALTNLGVFSQYAAFFQEHPLRILEALVASFLCGFLFISAGIFVSRRWKVEDRLSAVVCLWITNKILVIVFSARFFSPIEPTVAAMYTFPFYSLVVFVRWWRNRTLAQARVS